MKLAFQYLKYNIFCLLTVLMAVYCLSPVSVFIDKSDIFVFSIELCVPGSRRKVYGLVVSNDLQSY